MLAGGFYCSNRGDLPLSPPSCSERGVRINVIQLRKKNAKMVFTCVRVLSANHQISIIGLAPIPLFCKVFHMIFREGLSWVLKGTVLFSKLKCFDMPREFAFIFFHDGGTQFVFPPGRETPNRLPPPQRFVLYLFKDDGNICKC